MSILWEWIHKRAELTDDDPETGVKAGGAFGPEIFERLLEEEHGKLLRAVDRDVHDDSKTTTLPIVKEIARTYALGEVKPPWYVDLLNINLDNHDLAVARERTERYMAAFERDGTRITENLDFVPVARAGGARN
jgi:malate synthase